MRKQLVIVCEEKCRAYADYLSQFISLEDDDNDNIVGVKNGTVEQGFIRDTPCRNVILPKNRSK